MVGHKHCFRVGLVIGLHLMCLRVEVMVLCYALMVLKRGMELVELECLTLDIGAFIYFHSATHTALINNITAIIIHLFIMGNMVGILDIIHWHLFLRT